MERLDVHDGQRRFQALPASVRHLRTVPPETQHAEDELSFIHSGVMRAVSGDREFLIQAGDVTFIPAGERHRAVVLEDITLSYVLLERR
ncbi:cupin domain-containing protein [Deinococcus aestuarii]|uniref:cupin domain-containing protein n=1 Tax=Deinococcus aestuarii TaxID=2774531 RepID=UPI001C0BC6AD|nr:cupin domain-containing protein [Deinococcus aestuarii]